MYFKNLYCYSNASIQSVKIFKTFKIFVVCFAINNNDNCNLMQIFKLQILPIKAT